MNLITDRTEMDALLGKEKGTYSYLDLNRVENCVTEISRLFSEMGIVAELPTKTDWGPPGQFSAADWPVSTQMERYLRNIAIIRAEMAISIPIPISMDKLTWASANNIEKILETALIRIKGIKQSYRYSGEIYAGEELI